MKIFDTKTCFEMFKEQEFKNINLSEIYKFTGVAMCKGTFFDHPPYSFMEISKLKISNNNRKRHLNFNELDIENLLLPFAQYFIDIKRKSDYNDYFFKFHGLCAENSSLIKPFYIAPFEITTLNFAPRRIRYTDRQDRSCSEIFCYQDLLDAIKNKEDFLVLKVIISIDEIPYQKVKSLIRPISEFIAKRLIEYSNKLRGIGKDDVGFYISNEFFPPMFWTSNEDISLDEIMEQVDKFLDRYISYREFFLGKIAYKDLHYGRFCKLAEAGYDLDACGLTKEDLLECLEYEDSCLPCLIKENPENDI